MYKKIFIISISIFLFLPNCAYGQTTNISASYSVAIDKLTETVLYEKNKDTVTSMASTTKIMTCLIACEQTYLDNIVIINEDMLTGVEGTSLNLKVNDKISLLDLIKGAMLSSGNDAANAIAYYVGGSIDNFIEMMNDYSNTIGLNDTSFATPSGLDDNNHYTTAYDMAILTSYALDNELFSSICSSQNEITTINDEEISINNHNKLLFWYDDCIGVKTGYTDKSGRCLVSAFNYKENTIIIVILNASDDWNDHKKILDYSQKRYRTYSSNKELFIPVVGAKKERILCGYEYDVAYIKSINISVYYYPFIYAPINQGEKVGCVKIYSNDKLLKTIDIVAKESENIWQITK